MFDIEFNPKGNNLLDEQLVTSGLEMNWVSAVIGAATSVVGGIMGMNQASRSNKQAKRNYKKQKKFNKKVANKTNEYNKKVDANQKANYYAMRDFNHKVAMQNWERGKQIHDYEYDSAMKQFEKSQAIGAAQLGLNSREHAAAIESQELALNDAFLEQQFGIADSKAALQDELQRRNLEKQSIALEKRQINTNAAFDKQAQQSRLTIARSEADLDFQTQTSSMQQAYESAALDARELRSGLKRKFDEADIAARQQVSNLSGQLTQQNINRQEQFAQMQSIQSRKSTGTASIENTIEQLTSQGNFAKQSAMIDGLVAEGQASLGQAGKSTAKSRQSARAALQRNLMQLTSEMSGKRKQAGIQLAELNAEMSLAETGVGLNLQRIDAAVSGAQAAAGLNLEAIRNDVRAAERSTRIGMRRVASNIAGQEAQTDINMQRIGARLSQTQADVALQMGRIEATQGFALQDAALRETGVNNAINNANRDYLQNMQVLRANYDSAKKQTEINIRNIGIQKEVADLNTRAGMMLKPEKLPYNPRPERPPEHIFLESQKAIPGFTPSPAMQNIYAPLVQGLGSAASQLVGVDFTK